MARKRKDTYVKAPSPYECADHLRPEGKRRSAQAARRHIKREISRQIYDREYY